MPKEGRELVQHAEKGDLAFVKRYVDGKYGQARKDALNQRDDHGNTAIVVAAGGGHLDLVRELLVMGADVSARGGSGATALHRACIKEHDTIAHLLVDEGADVNATNDDHNTPLHFASWCGQKDLVRYLLRHGAKATIKNKRNRTAKDAATDAEVKKIIDEAERSPQPVAVPAPIAPPVPVVPTLPPAPSAPEISPPVSTESERIRQLEAQMRQLAREKEMETKRVAQLQKEKEELELRKSQAGLALIVSSDVKIDRATKLGGGAFGDVYAGIWRQKKYAIKLLKLDAADDGMFSREALNMFNAGDHPNIVPIRGVCIEPDNRMMVCDLCDGGTLLHAMANLSTSDRKRYAIDIARGMHHLHKRLILHRDLKPANILLHRGDGNQLRARVADFGVSRVCEATLRASTIAGTPAYMSPQVIMAHFMGAKADYKGGADVFSFGVMLYQMATGLLPQRTPTGVNVSDLGRVGIIAWRDLIERCTAPEEDDRPSFKEIVDLLEKA